MDRIVLDTSVLVKGIFGPHKSLPKDTYTREAETHEKCKAVIRLLEEKGSDVHIPRVCAVELAAVVKRLSSKGLARRVSKKALESFEVAKEEDLFETALDIAVETGCSGFDSYFISLARVKRAMLLTDDEGMRFHSKEAGVEALLIREIDLKDTDAYFEGS